MLSDLTTAQWDALREFVSVCEIMKRQLKIYFNISLLFGAHGRICFVYFISKISRSSDKIASETQRMKTVGMWLLNQDI